MDQTTEQATHAAGGQASTSGVPDTEPAPLQAPDDAINVTSDGEVRKVVTYAGEGSPPPLHARCLVHYVGRLAESGQVFMDTRAESNTKEPANVVAGRDSASFQVGLNLCVKTMLPGERCHLYVTPKYGYGERGSFSFPSVPPNAHLVYELELVDYDPEPQTRERNMMTYEERLEAAERLRLSGNELFQQGKDKEALSRYSMGLSYLDEDFLMQLEGRHLDKAHAVKWPIHLNMAAAQLRGGDYHTAVHNCSEVLILDPGNTKALFRRGRARHLLGQTEDALQDLTTAQKKAPDDAGIRREMQAVQNTIKEERRAEAKLFKGAFKAPPAPAASPAKPGDEPGSAGAAAAAGSGAATSGTDGSGSGEEEGSQGKGWFWQRWLRGS